MPGRTKLEIAGFRLSHTGPQELDVPKSLLDSLGWEALEATVSTEPGELGAVLVELREEECGHTWRTELNALGDLEPAGLATEMLRRASDRRPTTVFTYFSVIGGEREPVGTAAVSDRVTRDFPYEGFPVLARCFLRRPYRRKGLYPYLVQHRLDLCKRYWGEGLRAVHIGAADAAVLATISSGEGLNTGFLYLGDELLPVSDSEFRVKDFLGPSEGFVQDLLAVGAGRRGRAVTAFRRRLHSFVTSGAFSTQFSQLRLALARADAEQDCSLAEEHLSLAQLFALCEAIGLIT